MTPDLSWLPAPKGHRWITVHGTPMTVKADSEETPFRIKAFTLAMIIIAIIAALFLSGTVILMSMQPGTMSAAINGTHAMMANQRIETIAPPTVTAVPALTPTPDTIVIGSWNRTLNQTGCGDDTELGKPQESSRAIGHPITPAVTPTAMPVPEFPRWCN